jgi:predicted aldo/keto reductase-like oxidoreductase
MRYRTFPKLPDLKLSQFGFGIMRMPVLDNDYGKIDREASIKMIDIALEGGVNYFDTAYPYHKGDSEKFIGEYLVPKMNDHDIHIATKLPQWLVEKYEDYDKFLDEQLEKLGVDQIEFYLIHALGDEDWEKHKNLGVLKFLDKAIVDGKIKYPCFSFHGSIDTFKDIVDSYDKWIFAQIMLNYVDTNFQAGLEGMRYAYAKDIGIVIMEPLKGGLLVNELPDNITKLFIDNELCPVTTAMNWCYDFFEPTVILSGVSTLDQTKGQIEIANNAEAGKLSGIEREVLVAAKKDFKLVPCSDCQYCQPCPKDIKIPSVIGMYNAINVFGRDGAKKGYQKMIEENKGANQCIECGKCEGHCPQKIQIIDTLKKAHTVLSAE